jgi:hypothetical protein
MKKGIGDRKNLRESVGQGGQRMAKKSRAEKWE